MSNFKQCLYIVDFKYINGYFEYNISFDSGNRHESEKSNILRTVNNSCLDFDVKINFTSAYLIQLKQFLIRINDSLKRNNIDFSIFIKLYNEKVIINNDKEDIRSYGFCKIILKDSLNNIYSYDIPIKTSNPIDLKENILKVVNDNVNNIKNIDSLKNQLTLQSIPVVFSSRAAGYFIHEILGHSLESDFFSYYKDNFNDLKISPKLTVTDSIDGFENIIGLNKYDDMGILIRPLNVINKGKLCNIFSINQEESFDNTLYGFARRESYKTQIMPRMRSTFIEPFDDINEEKIISKYSSAIFFDKVYMGGANPQTGDYAINGQGFLINNGEKQNFITNLKLQGNLLKDLNSFEYIGNDFEMFGNYCNKLGQIVRVGVGGPTISLCNMSVEGDIYGKY